MKYYFRHIESTIHILRVEADTESQAMARASVGPIEDILEREFVDLMDRDESTRVKRIEIPSNAVPANLTYERYRGHDIYCAGDGWRIAFRVDGIPVLSTTFTGPFATKELAQREIDVAAHLNTNRKDLSYE
jgi:hypothetical protein